ncbi:NAD-dependent epimerase/dehydratase family protein [Nitratireductor kimnyeongensis]|uniref:NAD-dependent epimerase/dehydratase family protein n=1 Tax=Nitratireductor kimnyeongensis TaxID=430679 RepID=A0ABW0T7X8_9HYPH|nr:NAD(P)-dependent oxidoreductase [Nitratireductor kimnyeongensis]QZZ36052.1 NAD(P)-dependent oxidoreductase [Nitratireductor kimnyeongensis]
MTTPHSIVSGGTGLVGRFIVEALLAAGHRVTVLGRNAPPEGFFSKPLTFAPMELEPTSISTALFEGAAFFVHAAFDHAPGKYRGGEADDADGFRRRNLEGSVAMFRAARAAGVARTVFLSTRAVYGLRDPGVMLDERDVCRPDTLYGEVKLAAEEALSQLSGENFAGVSLRVTGVYGPAGYGRSHKWESLFADYLAGREIAPRVASEVHGEDVGSAVRMMLTLPANKLAGGVFNVSDLVVDRHDLLALVAEETGCKNPLPRVADCRAINVMKTDLLCALGWSPAGRALLGQTVRELLGVR